MRCVLALHQGELLLLEPNTDEGEDEEGEDVVQERPVRREDDHGQDGCRLEDEGVKLDVEHAQLERRRGDVPVRRLVEDKRFVR